MTLKMYFGQSELFGAGFVVFFTHVTVLRTHFELFLQILYMEDDDAVVSGVTAIIDLEGVTMGHFLQMTPLQMKKMTVVGQVKYNYNP